MEATVRIEGITIDGFKNVGHGELSFGNRRKSCAASILALYGQNGSGKTALIDALELLKNLLMGKAAGARIADCVDATTGSSAVEYRLSVMMRDGRLYDVRYSVKLKSEAAETEDGARVRKATIAGETLRCSMKGGETSFIMQTIISTEGHTLFGPDAKRNALIGRDRDLGFRLAVSKQMALKESRSFVFSQELSDAIQSNPGHDSSYFDLLQELVDYGYGGLFVINTANAGRIGLGSLPLHLRIGNGEDGTVAGSIEVSLESATDIPASLLDIARRTIGSINVVLTKIIPGLSIELRSLGAHLLDDNKDGVRVELVSHRGGIELPFRCESEGIKKIVSVLQLLINVYNMPSITVAIDELDSGVFEYLLGELLRVISDGGKGQLIFTSHNLRPLETIDRGFIAFTTANPDNRYIRFSNVKPNHNLRDFYYRDIVLGEQDEPIYEKTSNGEIAYAFATAGSGHGA